MGLTAEKEDARYRDSAASRISKGDWDKRIILKPSTKDFVQEYQSFMPYCLPNNAIIVKYQQPMLVFTPKGNIVLFASNLSVSVAQAIKMPCSMQGFDTGVTAYYAIPIPEIAAAVMKNLASNGIPEITIGIYGYPDGSAFMAILPDESILDGINPVGLKDLLYIASLPDSPFAESEPIYEAYISAIRMCPKTPNVVSLYSDDIAMLGSAVSMMRKRKMIEPPKDSQDPIGNKIMLATINGAPYAVRADSASFTMIRVGHFIEEGPENIIGLEGWLIDSIYSLAGANRGAEISMVDDGRLVISIGKTKIVSRVVGESLSAGHKHTAYAVCKSILDGYEPGVSMDSSLMVSHASKAIDIGVKIAKRDKEGGDNAVAVVSIGRAVADGNDFVGVTVKSHPDSTDMYAQEFVPYTPNGSDYDTTTIAVNAKLLSDVCSVISYVHENVVGRQNIASSASASITPVSAIGGANILSFSFASMIISLVQLKKV